MNFATPLVSIIVRSMGAALGTSGMGVGANFDESSSEPMVGRVLAKWSARREALWTPVKTMLADARRAVAAGDSERARILSDEIFDRYQIRFARRTRRGFAMKAMLFKEVAREPQSCSTRF